MNSEIKEINEFEVKSDLKEGEIKSKNELSSFIVEYPDNYNEIADRALRRLEIEYESTIKAEIKEKDISEKEKDFFDDDGESVEDDQQNEQNYQQLDENEGYGGDCFSEFEEFGNENNFKIKSKNEDFDEKKLEFVEDNKTNCDIIKTKNINLNDNDKSKNINYIDNTNEILFSEKKEENLEKDVKNIPKFNDLEKEKIKNAMKQINIKPPNWAKK